MKLGLTMFPTDTSIAPDRLAREAEARGFDSLFFPEHTHIPVARRTPYPAGGPLPEEYAHSLDPFVALAAARPTAERAAACARNESPARGPGQTLQVPSKPIVIRPPSAMRGTRRSPPESARNAFIASASLVTLKYSTFTLRLPKSTRAALV